MDSRWKDLANKKVRDDIEAIDEKITEEENKPNADRHRILRLKEQKLVNGLFNPQMWGTTYTKWQLPW